MIAKPPKTRHILTRLLLIMALMSSLLMNLACSKKTADEILQEAIDARQRNDVIGAILKCEKLIEQFPDDPAVQQAQLLLGNCYLTNGDTKRSREAFQVVVDKVGITDPAGQAALGQIISSYANEKNFKAAIEVAEKMIESVKDQPLLATSLRMTRVQLLFQDDRGDEASVILQNLIEQTEDEQLVLRLMQESSSIYIGLRKPEKLIENYDMFLKRFPESASRGELMVGKGVLLGQIADQAESTEEKEALNAQASAILQQATRMIRDDMDAEVIDTEKIKRGLRLAQLYYSMAEVEKAHLLLSRLLDEFPEAQEKPFILTYIAELFYQEGQYEDSKSWYAKVSQAAPDQEIGRRALDAIKLVDKKINQVNEEEAEALAASEGKDNEPEENAALEKPASEE